MRMQRQQLKPLVTALILAGCMTTASTAIANERESLEQLRNTTLNLINLLVQEGVLSKAKADTLIQQAEAARQAAEKSAETAPGSAGAQATQTAENQAAEDEKVVRVQYVPEHVKKELREELKKEVLETAKNEGWAYPGSIPDWLSHIAWEGNIRLRYELDSFPEDNAPAAVLGGSVLQNESSVTNTTNNRNRFRIRAQLGANLAFTDWLSGGLRITTGSITDPISPNQTLQTRDSKFSFALDRAFLKAKPAPWATVVGGRFENPFFATDLVWDPDINLDGLAASFNPKLTEQWTLFGTLGAFPIEEVQSSESNKAKDKYFFGAQAGLQWTSLNKSTYKLGLAIYDFRNVEGQPNTILDPTLNNGTVFTTRTRGNSTFDINAVTGTPGCGFGTSNNFCGLAAEFRELNLTGQIDLANFNPVHVILSGDYVKNIGFDANEILQRTGNFYPKGDTGYQVRLTVGSPKVTKRNDWQAFVGYKRLEADAVLDAFTDSDFHLGGTGAKGWLLGASYGIDKNVEASAKIFSADAIENPPFNGLPFSNDVLLVDLNARF